MGHGLWPIDKFEVLDHYNYPYKTPKCWSKKLCKWEMADCGEIAQTHPLGATNLSCCLLDPNQARFEGGIESNPQTIRF